MPKMVKQRELSCHEVTQGKTIKVTLKNAESRKDDSGVSSTDVYHNEGLNLSCQCQKGFSISLHTLPPSHHLSRPALVPIVMSYSAYSLT